MSRREQVICDFDRVSPEVIEAMSQIPTATLHEAYGQKGALNSNIRPIRPGMKLCGSVVTVKARPGDNLLVHKAMYVSRPGDVLLVDTGSYVEGGFWGEIMTVVAMQQGLAGLVTDGSVRDTDQIAELGFPVFSQGICIKGTTKDCPGTINHTIVVSGVKVAPGDLIVADSDGVVVVEKEDASDLLEKALLREEKEKKAIEELLSGKTTLELYGFKKKLEQLGIQE